jgi:tetratricopeptide (TPR) repeat protein
MRLKILAFTVCALALIGPAAVADATAEKAVLDALDNAPQCGKVGSAMTTAPVADMVLVDGFGDEGYAVDATPEAQVWFNQGVRLRWAFEHTEAVRAFRKARAIDPECGMCAWGEGWALGPNLNGGGNDEESLAAALKAAREARRLARDASPMQKQMIDALIQRYSGREATRAVRFARGMDRVARAHPDDVSMAAIAADAWMLSIDDDPWKKDGTAAYPATTRTMEILEHALAVKPNDPATIHLYIHMTEWSADPHKAIPYGEELAQLAPNASHLVHMPSHTYYRVGRYVDAMRANVNAVALDERYERIAPRPGGVAGGMPLHGHNLHFGMGGALMSGGGEDGLKLADGFLTTYPDIPASNAWRQIMANDAYALYGRFGDQEMVANLKEPPASNPLLRMSWRYARGEAAARRNDAAAVTAEAEAIAAINASIPDTAQQAKQTKPFIELFQKVLEGRAAMIAGDHGAAVAAYARAAAIQAMDDEGGDPPIIWYPTRRSLAAAMLASGDAAGAKAKIEELLKDWPADPYSYFVLAEAEKALGNTAAMDEALRQSRVEWIGGRMYLALA